MKSLKIKKLKISEKFPENILQKIMQYLSKSEQVSLLINQKELMDKYNLKIEDNMIVNKEMREQIKKYRNNIENLYYNYFIGMVNINNFKNILKFKAKMILFIKYLIQKENKKFKVSLYDSAKNEIKMDFIKSLFSEINKNITL